MAYIHDYIKIKQFFEKYKCDYFPSQISELLDVDYCTTFKILHSLEKSGHIETWEDGTYESR